MSGMQKLVAGLSLFLVAVALAAPVVFWSTPSSAAEGAEPPQQTAEPAEPPDFFTLRPADNGAVSFDQASPDEKAAIQGAAAWATSKHGQAVHDAWSRGSHHRANRARQRQAEMEAGLGSLDELGDLP